MNPKSYVVESEGLYHTGEFSREIPPSTYLGTIEDAVQFLSIESASKWVEDYGGTVIELPLNYPKDKDAELTINDVICDGLERDKKDLVITLRIKDGSILCNGWSLGDKFSIIRK